MVTSRQSNLTSLNVSDGSLSDAQFSCLLAGSRPQLTHLAIRYTRLGLAASMLLAQAFLPSLHSLTFTGINLSCKTVHILVHADMPELWSLDLSDNGLESNAVAHVSQGHWPKLKKLQLPGNNVDASGVAGLIKGNWSMLRWLSLDAHARFPEIFTLLGISGSAHSTPSYASCSWNSRCQELLKAGQNMYWPSLRCVAFSSRPLLALREQPLPLEIDIGQMPSMCY